MNTENICLSSQTIELSEENPNYLELVSRICYYDDVNKNNVMLSSVDADEKSKTLINMPVQAKYLVNSKGEPTFGGHEMRKDAQGNIHFETSSIGTHTEVYIENADVDVNGTVKNLPCLYAKYRIWTRYENCVAAVKRLFSLGKLYGSWELTVSSYEFKDGVKKITDYEFIANTLLGYENAAPAYGNDAKALSLSEEQTHELLVAEALSQDILSHGLDTENEAKEGKNLREENINVAEETVVNAPVADMGSDDAAAISSEPEKKEPETTAQATENPEQKLEQSNSVSEEQNIAGTPETSALTTYDLRRRVSEACRNKTNDWCYVAYMFPEEHEVWCEYDGAETELDYLKFNYSVENDVVTVTDPVKVRLTVSINEVNNAIAEKDAKIAESEKQIAEKDNLITTVSAELSRLKAEIAELQPYKDKFEQAEQERIEAETAQKKEELIASVVASKMITREEIENSEEMTGWVNELNKQAFMSVIGERVMASVEDKENQEVETSEVKQETVHVATNLNGADDDEMSMNDKVSAFRKYLGK